MEVLGYRVYTFNNGLVERYKNLYDTFDSEEEAINSVKDWHKEFVVLKVYESNIS